MGRLLLPNVLMQDVRDERIARPGAPLRDAVQFLNQRLGKTQVHDLYLLILPAYYHLPASILSRTARSLSITASSTSGCSCTYRSISGTSSSHSPLVPGSITYRA